MKICLVYPRSMTMPQSFRKAVNIDVDASNTLPPLGMLYIISNSKYKIDFIDNRIENLNDDELLIRLKKYDIVGFGGTIFEVKQARAVSKELMNLGIKTIYGGSNATVNWNLYLGQFDVIFRGEAEEEFDELIKDINGINIEYCFTFVNGTFYNPLPFKINDLNKLQYPARDMIDLNKYRREEFMYFGNVMPVDTIVSSRGCPFDCYFCSSKHVWNQRYSFREVDNVIKEMRFMQSHHKTKGFYFREDNFTLNKERLLEFCKKAKALKTKWMCESRVDTLDEECIKSMKESGCAGVWFGIERTNNEDLKRINKGYTIEKAKQTLELCKKYGLRTGGAFMLGFPFDDKESIKRTIKESKELLLTHRFYSRVWAIPKSKMYDEIKNKNLDEIEHENIVLPATENLTAQELNCVFYKLTEIKNIPVRLAKRLLGKKLTEQIILRFPNIVKIISKIRG